MPVQPFILIIDDEKNISAVLAHLLRSAGFRAVTASGALEGVGVARKDRPDLILMDMMMPGIEGTTATRMIKDAPELVGIPVVLISALPEEEARRRMSDSGAVDFIAKPFYREGLLEVIRRWLPQGRAVASKPRDDTRVLVVDDDPQVTKFVGAALRNLGLGTWEAHDAKEALRLAKTLLPGLIITDVHMPGIEGPDFCLQLKSSSDTRDIPVIFLSGDRSEETRQASGSSGGVAYFEKPLDVGGFLATIQGMLRPPPKSS
ncbi:MAG TPA: response regulator [Planctomycetota bacterium]|nr:response regulator [Planctomycetota bacterium]